MITGKSLGLTAVKGYLMNVKDVADFFGVSERLVQKRMADGTFPVRWISIGGKVRRFDSADVDAALKILKEDGTAELPQKVIKKFKEMEEVKLCLV